ncbi:MAG: endolytic transglycosylase MltG [Eggerthellaceae bacterium]|nr:endolytic transglycosylase MltG [Eggerthellaceae bacterium]
MSPRRQITYSQNPNHAARVAHAKGEKAFRTYDTSALRPKRDPKYTLIAIALLVVVVLAIVWAVFSFVKGCTSTPAAPVGQKIEITVAEGEGPRSVGKTLAEKGLVSNATEFTDKVAAQGDVTIHPGTYTLTGGQSIDEIIAVLQTPVLPDMFTIPEGYSISQVAGVIEQATAGRIAASDFVAAASDASAYAASYDFLGEVGTNSLEGFLFPKTYPITENSTADSLIRAMLDQFRDETANLDWSYGGNYQLSRYDMVKLASIVEKEADDNVRAEVASVFYNRLGTGMRLESDATVAYFVGHDPTPQDVEIDDPYNTYLNDGLTPTPINSPGLASLQAVCAPATTDYLYFYFADNGNGGLNYSFSVTYEEHQSNF